MEIKKGTGFGEGR